MKREDWEVKEYGIRPAGKPDECLYCKVKKGKQHKTDCVIRQKTIVTKIEIEILQHVPEFWNDDDINFHLNESSWCADNIIDELLEQSERIGCLCGQFKGSFLRDATKEDEENFSFSVHSIPS
jgi:hypothetical protein